MPATKRTMSPSRARLLALSLVLALWPAGARATITRVKNIATAGSTATGTTLAVTVPAAGVAAGNRVIVTVALDPTSGTVSCADSNGNVYANDLDVTQGSVASGVRTVIFSALVTTALVSGDTITVTHPSLAARAVNADEFSGIVASGALDQVASAPGSSTAPSSGNTATTAQVNELLIGAIGVETRSETFTLGSGYTLLASIGSSTSSGTATTNVTMNAEYQIVSATGAYLADGMLGTSRLWATGIATYRDTCGNGAVDPGEQCDGGACCSATCTFLSSATVCRASAGVCDLAENCTGASPSCPGDVLQPSGTVCGAAAGPCDLTESCTGSSAACPTDEFLPSSTVCRAATDICDLAENCTGSSGTCPTDAFLPSSTVCRAAADVCDLTEHCTGLGAQCPTDAFQPSMLQCRATAGACDVAESCTGTGPGCPSDSVRSGGGAFVCRPVADACDVAESCAGSSADCPSDGFAPSTTVCRPSTNSCNFAESCTGSSTACPADTGEPDGDGDGTCDGDDDCPAISDPGQADTDGDGAGDACDPCTNSVPNLATNSEITVSKLLAPAGNQHLKYSGVFSAIPSTPAIDATAKGVRVVLTTNTGTPVLDATIPGGLYDTRTGIGWKKNGGGTVFVYRNKSSTPIQGIIKVALRTKVNLPGTWRFGVAGRKGTYPIVGTEIPVRGAFIIDSPLAQTGQCGESAFPGPLPPNCALNPNGATLHCK